MKMQRILITLGLISASLLCACGSKNQDQGAVDAAQKNSQQLAVAAQDAAKAAQTAAAAAQSYANTAKAQASAAAATAKPVAQ